MSKSIFLVTTGCDVMAVTATSITEAIDVAIANQIMIPKEGKARIVAIHVHAAVTRTYDMDQPGTLARLEEIFYDGARHAKDQS